MRRYITALCVVGLVGAGATTLAFAAAPSNRSYSGIGRNYWNQGGRWVRHGNGSYNFRTDKPYFCGKNNGVPRGSDCQYITSFHGTYTSSCNGGTLHVSASNIPINQKTNTYSAQFSSSGAQVKIWGSFTSGGAKVNYRVTFRSGCASWVRGNAS